MPDGVTIATFLSISISVGMIAVCGIIANIICDDINDFYADSMKELKAFKVRNISLIVVQRKLIKNPSYIGKI